jgi:hypothetical protein
MEDNLPPMNNIFERALFEKFLSLGVGVPNEKIMEVIQRAGSEMTREAKAVLNKEYDMRRAKRGKLHRNVSGI